APFELREQIGGGSDRLAAVENIRDAGPRHREQHHHGHRIAQHRQQRARGGEACECRAHERYANTGSICASMWKRSPGSDGPFVVGAKKVARVKFGERSSSRISSGASRVTPITRNLSPSMRSSVT